MRFEGGRILPGSWGKAGGGISAVEWWVIGHGAEHQETQTAAISARTRDKMAASTAEHWEGQAAVSSAPWDGKPV